MPNRDGRERLRVTMWDAGAASDCADPKRHGQLQLREDYAQACARHLPGVSGCAAWTALLYTTVGRPTRGCRVRQEDVRGLRGLPVERVYVPGELETQTPGFSVLIEMEVAVRNVYADRGQEVDACVLIPQWGKYIKNKFDLDNLLLTHQHSETSNTQVRAFRVGWSLRVVRVVVFSEHNAQRVCYSNFGFKLNASIVFPVLRCLNALFIHSM